MKHHVGRLNAKGRRFGRLRRLLAAAAAIWIALTTTACNYRDLDELLFVASILVDYDEKSGEVVLYIEAFKPLRSSEPDANDEKRIVYSVRASTMGKALQDLNTRTSSYVTFTHCKVILFTTKVAEHGFKDYFDVFNRDQEFIVRAFLAIYDGEVGDYVSLEVPEENMTGIYLYDMINNEYSISPQGERLDLMQFLNNVHSGNRVNIMPVISTTQGIPEGAGSSQSGGGNGADGMASSDGSGGSQGASGTTEKKYMVDGLALIRGYVMVGRLNPFRSLYYNLMQGYRALDTITIPNPQEPDKLCNLMILDSSIKNDMQYKDGKISLYRHIQIKTYLSETQADIDLTDAMMRRLAELAEQKVRRQCMQLFYDYKEKNLDVFYIQCEFGRNFPKETLADEENIIQNATMDIEVTVKVEGSTTTEGFD